ncbi:hypothetical protein TTHT_1986 [Thermotomaculum hydrothermale]|uniref:DGQHR domain-containing protein n=1 Tax=Thermotomaculum hydrothermale TaxID=981385 RepID=A0A7R6PIW4_9BACT|nr:DGQHR domain-containing protein [Thermotomaculum hydrothermale]BBB33429.1 hypothetical protein TTHT_1986 [Thermotomaculum hydrothermale]
MRVFAISLKQKGLPLYLFKMKASDLLKLTIIEPRTSENKTALQRILDKKRLKEIAIYLLNNDAAIPNNIIVNFNEKTRFIPQNINGIECGYLEIPDEKCAYILDGQHRLMAFEFSNEVDFEIPVVGFLNLDLKTAAHLFTVINTTQKPLSKSLLLDIRHYIGDTKQAEKIATDTALKLSQSKTSPLYKKIKVSKGEKGVISLEQLVKLILPFVDIGGILERSKHPEKAIENYLNAFFETFELPINSASIQVALSPIFERVIRRGKNENLNLNSIEGFKEVFSYVRDFKIKPQNIKTKKDREGIIRQFLSYLPETTSQKLDEWLL